MRLRDMQRIILAEMPALTEVGFEGMTLPNGSPGMTLHNWGVAYGAMARLAQVPPLTAVIVECLAAPGWSKMVGDPGVLVLAEGQGVNHALVRLVARADALVRAINDVLPEQAPSTISIRLPVVQDLSELSNLVEDLQLVLGQPTSRIFGPCITFQGLDTGSSWLEVMVSDPAGAAAVVSVGIAGLSGFAWLVHRFLGSLLRLAYDAALRYQDLQRNQEYLRALLAGNQIVETVAKSAQDELDAFVEKSASALVSEHAPSTLPPEQRTEAIASARAAIFKAAELLRRDVSFHPKLLDQLPNDEREANAVKATWLDPAAAERTLFAKNVAQIAEHVVGDATATPADGKVDDSPRRGEG